MTDCVDLEMFLHAYTWEVIRSVHLKKSTQRLKFKGKKSTWCILVHITAPKENAPNYAPIGTQTSLFSPLPQREREREKEVARG